MSLRRDATSEGRPTGIREQKLVDADAVHVNLVGGELLDQSLSFVEGEEFGDWVRGRRRVSEVDGRRSEQGAAHS